MLSLDQKLKYFEELLENLSCLLDADVQSGDRSAIVLLQLLMVVLFEHSAPVLLL